MISSRLGQKAQSTAGENQMKEPAVRARNKLRGTVMGFQLLPNVRHGS